MALNVIEVPQNSSSLSRAVGDVMLRCFGCVNVVVVIDSRWGFKTLPMRFIHDQRRL